MENRKSHHQLESNEKINRSTQSTENIDPIIFILEKYDSFFSELSTEKEGFQILKKEINTKISSWITGLYHTETRTKIVKNLDEIESIFYSINDYFEQFVQTRKSQTENSVVIFLNVLCNQHLTIVIETLKNIENLIKVNYQDEALLNKIENFKTTFDSKKNNITKFHEAVKMYLDNKKNLESKEILLKKMKAKNNALRELIEENEKEIKDKQLTLNEIEDEFAYFNKTIKKLKDCLSECINKDTILTHLTNEIYLFEQSLELTRQFFNNITTSLEKSKSFLVDIHNGYETSKANLRLSFDDFKKYHQCLKDIEKNHEEMKERINVIRSMSIDTKSNSLLDMARNNLISINQSDLLTQNLKEKIIEFASELVSLEKEFKSIKEIDHETAGESFSKNRQAAIIDSAEYIDLSEEAKTVSLPQAKALIDHIKKQIKTHAWEVHGIGNHSTLLDELDSQKHIMKATKLITTNHVNRMLPVLNASTLNPEDKVKGCQAAVDQVKTITQEALQAVSLFRANTTHIAYRNLYEDIDNFHHLLQSRDVNEISELIDAIMDEHQTTYGLVEFETKCQNVRNKNLPVTDKLIQFYFIAKDYLYHKDLLSAEREYLYRIILILKETDAIASINNIKTEIINRSKNHAWIILSGGSFIDIDKINYKVLYHVKRMWKIFDETNESELIVFSNRHHFAPYQVLSKIMRIAHDAVLNVPFSRNKESQSFYIDILTGKYLITNERSHSLQCRK